jgi:hypothetical protein
MFIENAQQISDVIKNYFDGIFQGDVTLLRQVFHPRALLFGDVDGQPYEKNLEEYLNVVQNRDSPMKLGEGKRMKIISIEVLGNVSYAKLHVPMFDFNYYDFIALNKINGKWWIVNKLFTS